MLKKTKGEEPSVVRAPNPVSAAAKTIIGEHISIEGNIRGGENLVIEGTVEGSIDLEKCHLTVGPKGEVKADIQAGKVTIGGRVIGNIKAQDQVEITKDANFNGDIKTKSISVEDGAYLKAVIEVEREPQKKAALSDKTINKAASGADKESITLVSEFEKGM